MVYSPPGLVKGRPEGGRWFDNEDATHNRLERIPVGKDRYSCVPSRIDWPHARKRESRTEREDEAAFERIIRCDIEGLLKKLQSYMQTLP